MKIFWYLVFLALTLWGSEKVFVVERENSSLAVIKNGIFDDRIDNMRNMNHATVKFEGADGYAITRDGYIIRFDPRSHRKLNEYQTSQSAIGFVVEPSYIAVANYDNKTVQILDRNLTLLQTITTDSKNVGIKTYKDMMIFALMDKDELWVCQQNSPDRPLFHVIKKFENVGEIPFDAMIKNNLYIVGFFNSPWVGVVDLETMTYQKIPMIKEENRPVLKVPHFGFWSIGDHTIFIPSVGEAAVMAFDDQFHFRKKILTAGLPVFTALSPDKKLLAVTFSGKDFPTVQIIDALTLEIIKTLTFEGNVLHVRWSDESPSLYVSVNTANEVQIFDTQTWTKQRAIPVKRPSGIFLYHTSKEQK